MNTFGCNKVGEKRPGKKSTCSDVDILFSRKFIDAASSDVGACCYL